MIAGYTFAELALIEELFGPLGDPITGLSIAAHAAPLLDEQLARDTIRFNPETRDTVESIMAKLNKGSVPDLSLDETNANSMEAPEEAPVQVQVKHKVRIAHREVNGVRAWRAECICGWSSDWYRTRSLASIVALDHKEQYA